MYILRFVECKNKSDATLKYYIKKNKLFKDFLKECKKKKECRSLDLPSFLIKPTQRLCKYPLLLQSLTKECDEGSEIYQRIQQAINMFHELLNIVNVAKARTENRMRMEEIQNILRKGNEKIKLVSQKRDFVTEGHLKCQAYKKEGYYYLFNDLFIFTADKRQIKIEIPLRLAAINDPSESGLTFELSNVASQEKFQFEFKDVGEKNSLVSHIQFHIQQLKVNSRSNQGNSRATMSGDFTDQLPLTKPKLSTLSIIKEENSSPTLHSRRHSDNRPKTRESKKQPQNEAEDGPPSVEQLVTPPKLVPSPKKIFITPPQTPELNLPKKLPETTKTSPKPLTPPTSKVSIPLAVVLQAPTPKKNATYSKPAPKLPNKKNLLITKVALQTAATKTKILPPIGNTNLGNITTIGTCK